MASGPGWRTSVPADFKGEQSAAFLAILPRIKIPGLRARLADVAWSNDRKAAGDAAAMAMPLIKNVLMVFSRENSLHT